MEPEEKFLLSGSSSDINCVDVDASDLALKAGFGPRSIE